MKFKVLRKEFYKNKGTIELSKELLGKLLVTNLNGQETIGRIVETEAYLYNDPAAHSFVGLTERNKSVFEEAGTSYVYFIYGSYYCFNVASNEKGKGEAVLIRALEPIKGEDIMQQRIKIFNSRRKKAPTQDLPREKLCNGPGKLCIALNIDKSLDGHKLWEEPLFLAEDSYQLNEEDILVTKRIGITKAAEMPYRFYIKNNKFISRP